MRILSKILLGILLLFACSANVIAVENSSTPTILVLPDNMQFDSTNYAIYPDASIIFATDLINDIKRTSDIKIVSMKSIRDAIRSNSKINTLTNKALKEFKYNYNIAFIDLRAIAKYFKTDYVLLITSQTDSQNYFLRRTVWDFLNIPGTTVIDPVYKLCTYVALINVNEETILWDKTFYKRIGTMESRMIAQNLAPETEQLQKIKQYSQNNFTPTVSLYIRGVLSPNRVIAEKGTFTVPYGKTVRIPSPTPPNTQIREATIAIKTGKAIKKGTITTGKAIKKGAIKTGKAIKTHTKINRTKPQDIEIDNIETDIPAIDKQEVTPEINEVKNLSKPRSAVPRRIYKNNYGVMINEL